MPRVNVPVTTLTRTSHVLGAAATTPAEVAGDATNHHDLANSGAEFLIIRNNAATPRLVTLEIPLTPDGQTVTNKTFTVAASGSVIVGPFPTHIYNQPAEPGKMYFQVAHLDLKLQAFKIPV